ncbi:MAG: YeeE/YedE thiosulfate transporter family protein [Paracoccaceae bacterium]
MQASWLWGLLGGLVIGSAGAVYLLVNGRIMGASGILGGLVDRGAQRGRVEKASFLLGLVGLPVVLGLVLPMPATHLSHAPAVIVAAGLLVGAGTRLANGCTSGHGVCGISRLSVAGIAATLVYLLAGVLTVLLFRHLWGVI